MIMQFNNCLLSFTIVLEGLTEIDRLILNFHPGDFFQHSSCVSMGHRKYKYANEICLLCLFTELGAVCLQFREDPKSTNRALDFCLSTRPVDNFHLITSFDKFS